MLNCHEFVQNQSLKKQNGCPHLTRDVPMVCSPLLILQCENNHFPSPPSTLHIIKFHSNRCMVQQERQSECTPIKPVVSDARTRHAETLFFSPKNLKLSVNPPWAFSTSIHGIERWLTTLSFRSINRRADLTGSTNGDPPAQTDEPPRINLFSGVNEESDRLLRAEYALQNKPRRTN